LRRTANCCILSFHRIRAGWGAPLLFLMIKIVLQAFNGIAGQVIQRRLIRYKNIRAEKAFAH
jgi:hypothetical protein